MFNLSLTGFDPWRESSKALADMIEKEQVSLAYDNTDRLKTVPPPGFSSNNFAGAFNNPHTGIGTFSGRLLLFSLNSGFHFHPKLCCTFQVVL